MRGLVLTFLLFVTSCGAVSDIKSTLENKREEIKAQNIVTNEDALKIRQIAKTPLSTRFQNNLLHKLYFLKS